MGLYTKFVSKILFPIHEKVKGHSTVAVMKQMEQSQWWETEVLEAYRIERLKRFLLQVSEHVPYYKKVFISNGFDVNAVNSLHDLTKLPFLTKADIRSNTDELKADNTSHLARFNTGGSSGEPLIFYIGNERVSHDVAAKWRATRWWNVDIGDPEIVIWGSPIELGSQDRIRLMRDKLLRSTLIPAFEMSEQKLEGFVRQIMKIRPKMLFGYPSALSHIAKYAIKKSYQMNTLGIRVAFVTSERPYDHQREMIEEVFGCPVANGYGGRDAGFIAHQCPQGNMHITAEDIIVEIIGPDGNPLPNGQAGEVVVTHLATSEFPFIRYRTGDIAVLDDNMCPCGRGLPLISEIQGRTTDFIVAQDGTVMHGLALIYIIRDIPNIETFKIIQEKLDYVRVLLVVHDGFEQSYLESIRQGFAGRLGDGVTVEVEIVEDIPAEASGKFRYVVSHVA